jgi:hypothetical protein
MTTIHTYPTKARNPFTPARTQGDFSFTALRAGWGRQRVDSAASVNFYKPKLSNLSF